MASFPHAGSSISIQSRETSRNNAGKPEKQIQSASGYAIQKFGKESLQQAFRQLSPQDYQASRLIPKEPEKPSEPPKNNWTYPENEAWNCAFNRSAPLKRKPCPRNGLKPGFIRTRDALNSPAARTTVWSALLVMIRKSEP